MEFGRELLAAFRRGERAAMEQVYWGCVDEIERVVRSALAKARIQSRWQASASDVRDLVQETFVRAFDERARIAYDGLRPYLPFLCTIARNLVVDAVRKQGREITTAELELPDEPEPELPWTDRATVRAVEEYLAGLDPELRAVHERLYVQNESQEAAGRALGLSRQQVRTLAHKLRAGLARHLRNQSAETPVKMIREHE
jgi:RNA polymerase sigma-70 factor, ECF subfamily